MFTLAQFSIQADEGFGAVMALFAVLLMFLTAIIHITLAFSVWMLATHLEQRQTWFIGPLLWGLLTLITGLMGMLAFWLIHYSRLKSRIPPPPALGP